MIYRKKGGCHTDAFEELKQINAKIRALLEEEERRGYSGYSRIFGKDSELEKFKCFKCAFQDFVGLRSAPNYPCSVCKDRPTRTKDRSEFVPDMSEDAKEKISKEYRSEDEGTGKYNY